MLDAYTTLKRRFNVDSPQIVESTLIRHGSNAECPLGGVVIISVGKMLRVTLLFFFCFFCFVYCLSWFVCSSSSCHW